MLLSYIAEHLATTLDGLLAGIQSNTSFLKAFCKLTLTAGHHAAFESGQVREAACHAHRTRVRDLGPSIGLGSGAAIALESSLSIIAIPTTYAGSEMPPIDDLTEDGMKGTGRDLRVLLKTIIYDPELSRTIPTGPVPRECHE